MTDEIGQFFGPIFVNLINNFSRQHREYDQLVVLGQLLQLLDEALRLMLYKSQVILTFQRAFVLLDCHIVELIALVRRIDQQGKVAEHLKHKTVSYSILTLELGHEVSELLAALRIILH